MKTFDADIIYQLLPPAVRMRDVTPSGTPGPLYALIEVIAAQANIVDDNLYQLYDDLFIETCAPWVIPYIGDLIGYRPLRAIPPDDATARSDVADTIGMRRRKGTLVALDQLATDVLGRPAVAVEFFERLAVSQYVRNHVRPQNAIVDVHGYQTAIDINTAFDLAPRSADVRRIRSGGGRYNIPNIGLFVWRLAAYGGASLGLGPVTVPMTNALIASTAREVGPNRYTFDPFGDDVALVNPPLTPAEFTLPVRQNVPYPLRRYPLFDELAELRAGTVTPDDAAYFGLNPVFAVYDVTGAAIAPQHLAVCDLDEWAPSTDAGVWVTVDPERGRLVCNPAAFSVPPALRVAYAYAFSGDYGAGTYEQPRDAGEGDATTLVADLAAATPAAWVAGIVEIGDSGLYMGDVTLTPGAQALIVRAEDDARPVIAGNVTIVAVPGGNVTLRGLGIGGTLTIAGEPAVATQSSTSSASSSTLGGTPADAGDPSFTLTLEYCTLRSALHWTYGGGGNLTIAFSLCAPLLVDPAVVIAVNDSVVDAGFPVATGAGSSISSSSGNAADPFAAIAGPDAASACGDLTLTACTVFGDISARETVLIENSIITGNVVAARTQSGCIRYSYLTPNANVPPRFRCQPDLAIAAALTAAQAADPGLNAAAAAAITTAIEGWLVPAFTSRRKSDAGYAQLADSCPLEIRTGAESEDEMGVFHALYWPRRENNLYYRFDEYLRVGLQAGIIHAS